MILGTGFLDFTASAGWHWRIRICTPRLQHRLGISVRVRDTRDCDTLGLTEWRGILFGTPATRGKGVTAERRYGKEVTDSVDDDLAHDGINIHWVEKLHKQHGVGEL